MRKLKLFDKVALAATMLIVTILIWGSVLRYWTVFPKENRPNENVVSIIESGDCLLCHSKGIESQKASKHLILGRYFDNKQKQAVSFFVIDTMYRNISQTGIASQVDLSRLENVAKSNQMPPCLHTFIYLNSYINISKRNVLTKWIYDVRSNCYATNGVVDNMRGEPLQPLVISSNDSTLLGCSRFDKYMLGNSKALLDAEIMGYNYFKEHNCATCHIGSAVGGIGTAHLGRYNNHSSHTKALKRISAHSSNDISTEQYIIPSLRNISEKHHFFRDSSAIDLRGAVSKMADLQALPNKIPDNQLDMIVLFLKTLKTDETNSQ